MWLAEFVGGWELWVEVKVRGQPFRWRMHACTRALLFTWRRVLAVQGRQLLAGWVLRGSLLLAIHRQTAVALKQDQPHRNKVAVETERESN